MLSPSGSVANFRSTRLTSDSVVSPEQMARWQNIFSRQVLKSEIRALVEPFFFQTTIHSAPSLTLTSSATTPVHIVRNSDSIGDGDDRLAIHILLDGGAVFFKGNNDILQPGDAILLSNGTPFALLLTRETTRFLSIYFPKEQFEALLSDCHSAIGTIISAGSEPLRQLTRYLLSLDSDPAIQFFDRRTVGIQIYDLAAFMFGAARNTSDLIKRRGVKSARLIAMKAYVLTNLSRPNLSANIVARVHGVSEGYVRKLFVQHFDSFNQFITDYRLRRVYTALRDNQLSDWPLSELVSDAGFRSPSYFYRAFKRRYGITPSEAKAEKSLDRIARTVGF